MRFLRPLLAAALAVCLLAFAAPPASARLMIQIDKSSQRMTVSLDGEPIHTWPVSTGLRAYDTPSGSYTPFRLEEDHYSKEWDDAPMPHSIFFTRQGHAIHGTSHVRNIGRPASHGCVRLEPENARALFDLVRRVGLPNTRVVLAGVTPATSPPAVARRRPPEYGEQPGYVERAPSPYEPRSYPYEQRPYEGRPYETRPYDSRQYDQRPYEARPYESRPSERPYEQRPSDPRQADPRQADPSYDDRAPPYGPRRGERVAPRERTGYWIVRPDGSREFVDRERDSRPPPPPYFFGRPPGY
jgi:hypothetical protein